MQPNGRSLLSNYSKLLKSFYVYRCYGRRSHEAHSLRDIYVPAHLYGQLALTKFGLENLVKVTTFLILMINIVFVKCFSKLELKLCS
jgi:hypothetical protein